MVDNQQKNRRFFYLKNKRHVCLQTHTQIVFHISILEQTLSPVQIFAFGSALRDIDGFQ